MPGLIETSQVGAREDLSSYIVNIEKTDTPLFTMIPKDTVNKTHFETQVDDYGETDDVSGVTSSEDADTFDNMAENRGLIENYVMKMWEKPMVDDFSENVNENPALSEGEYVESVRKAIVRLKFRMEKLLLSQVEATAQSAGVPYRTCSMFGFLTGAAPTGSQVVPSRFRTPSAQRYTSTVALLDEEDLHDLLQEVFESTHGMGKFTGLVGSELKQRISSFSIYRANVASNTFVRQINNDQNGELTWMVDVLVGDFGQIDLVPTSRMNYFDSSAVATSSAIRRGSGLILDLSKWGLAFKRKPGHKRLEDKGGGPRGIVDTIFGLRCKSPKANCPIVVSG
jgi:hypothetical protein